MRGGGANGVLFTASPIIFICLIVCFIVSCRLVLSWCQLFSPFGTYDGIGGNGYGKGVALSFYLLFFLSVFYSFSFFLFLFFLFFIFYSFTFFHVLFFTIVSFPLLLPFSRPIISFFLSPSLPPIACVCLRAWARVSSHTVPASASPSSLLPPSESAESSLGGIGGRAGGRGAGGRRRRTGLPKQVGRRHLGSSGRLQFSGRARNVIAGRPARISGRIYFFRILARPPEF